MGSHLGNSCDVSNSVSSLFNGFVFPIFLGFYHLPCGHAGYKVQKRIVSVRLWDKLFPNSKAFRSREHKVTYRDVTVSERINSL